MHPMRKKSNWNVISAKKPQKQKKQKNNLVKKVSMVSSKDLIKMMKELLT